MPDLYEAGGIPAVHGASWPRLGLLDLDLPHRAPARPWARTSQGAVTSTTTAIRPIDNPVQPRPAALPILWGNLAPDGCVVKRSAVAPEMLVHSGPARVFDSEEDAIAAIYAGEIVPRRRGGHPLRRP